MKTIKILILIFPIIFVSEFYSQSDTAKPHKWSATAFIGESLPFDYDSYLNSVNTGIEISYNYNPYIAIFFNGNFYFLRLGKNNRNYVTSEKLVETSIGTKYFFNPGHDKIFVQIGLGDYQLIKHYDYTGYGGGDYVDNIDKFGVSIGLGSDIHIYKRISAIINAKLHFVGFINNEEGLIFWGINSGIKYEF